MSPNDTFANIPAPQSPVDDPAVALPHAQAPGDAPAQAVPADKPAKRPGRTPDPAVRAVLDTLAHRFPQLFGTEPRPLKRGIFEDLTAAGLDGVDRETLKLALAQHTRSTRYLQAVAHAQPRHDLQGQPVEAMAPEHSAYAVLEVFRRRQRRDGALAHDALVRRLVHLMVTSELGASEWADAVQTRDEGLARALQEARDQFAMQLARDEALLRAFDASGIGLDEFARQYGVPAHTARLRLASARRRRTGATSTA